MKPTVHLIRCDPEVCSGNREKTKVFSSIFTLRWCFLPMGKVLPWSGGWVSSCRTVLLKVWSPAQQCLHHLGNCWKCRLSGPFILTCQVRNSGMGLTRVPICSSLCSSQVLSGSENQHFKGLGDQTSEKCLLVMGYWLVLDSGACPLQQTPSTQVGPEAMLQLNDHLEAVTVRRAHRLPIH